MEKNIMTQHTAALPFCKACHNILDAHHSLGVKDGYALLPCPACGTVTVNPFPSVEELIKFYQAYEGSTHYQSKKDKKIRRATRRVRRMMALSKGKKFLDVGCNYGFTVAAALNLGAEAHGIDIDTVAVGASQEMFGKDKFTAIAVQDYAAAGHKADMVYTSEVIEHVPDPDSFVAAIAAILNKGGILYLTTPDGGHFMVPKNFTDWPAVRPPEHIIYFTRKGLTLLLEKHGFKIKKVFFSLKPGMRLIAEKV
jgi:SAM-dependent methyltransferase